MKPDQERTYLVYRPARTAHSGRRRNLAFTAAITAAAITGLAPASAFAISGPGSFGLAPVPTAAGQTRSYFDLSVSPGKSAKDVVLVTNEGTSTEQLTIGAGSGASSAAITSTW